MYARARPPSRAARTASSARSSGPALRARSRSGGSARRQPHDREVLGLTARGRDVRQGERAAPFPPDLGGRVVHVDLDQVAAVAEGDRASPSAASARASAASSVMWPAAARSRPRRAAAGARPPCTGRWRSRGRARDVALGVRRAEAVDERGEHRRVQEPLARSARRRSAAPAVAKVGVVPSSRAAIARASPGRGRVSASSDDDHVARRRLEPLLQRPRLADPAGRRLGARDHRARRARGPSQRWRPWSSRPPRGPRGGPDRSRAPAGTDRSALPRRAPGRPREIVRRGHGSGTLNGGVPACGPGPGGGDPQPPRRPARWSGARIASSSSGERRRAAAPASPASGATV